MSGSVKEYDYNLADNIREGVALEVDSLFTFAAERVGLLIYPGRMRSSSVVNSGVKMYH
jgi:hypothetical protein